MNYHDRKPWWRAYVAGLLGGAAGTAAMGLYMRAVQRPNGRPRRQKEHDVSLVGRRHAEGESAPGAVGRILYKKIARKEPESETKNKLATAVHWAYGTEMGGAYGLIRRRAGKVDLLAGLAWGLGLWALGDELAVPLLGLAEGPKAHPVAIHAEGLGAHLVYGLSTAAATQLLERVI